MSYVKSEEKYVKSQTRKAARPHGHSSFACCQPWRLSMITQFKLFITPYDPADQFTNLFIHQSTFLSYKSFSDQWIVNSKVIG